MEIRHFGNSAFILIAIISSFTNMEVNFTFYISALPNHIKLIRSSISSFHHRPWHEGSLFFSDVLDHFFQTVYVC